MTYTEITKQRLTDMSPLQQRRLALFAARIFIIVVMLCAFSLRGSEAATDREEEAKERTRITVCEPAFAIGDVIGSPFVVSHLNLSDYLTCR